MMRLPLLSALALCCLCAGLVQAAPPLQTRTWAQVAIYPELRAPASLQSRNHSRLSAQVGARIAALPVDVGHTVAAGAVLARLDDRDAHLAVERAQAQLGSAEAARGLAKSALDRARSLLQSGFVSPQALEQASAELDMRSAEVNRARAALNTEREQLKKHVIRAPFSGVIMSRAQLGEWASPGATLVELVDLERPEVSARIATGKLGSLRGAKNLRFVSQGQSHALRLLRVVPVVNPATRDQDVRLATVGKAPAIGSSGQLLWNDPQPHVPPQLLVKRGSAYGVFVMAKGRARWHPLSGVEEGRPARADLAPDTLLVVTGQQSLQAGTAVGGR